jgi:hypothetical protein
MKSKNGYSAGLKVKDVHYRISQMCDFGEELDLSSPASSREFHIIGLKGRR